MSEDTDLKFVDLSVERIGRQPDKVLEILQAIQGEYGYLPKETLKRVCEISEITPAQISGVSTFYDFFRHKPVGKHIIKVCIGTACHVKGAGAVYDAFRRYLNIAQDEDTDAERLFTVEKIACLGCCTLAPAVQIDDITYGHLTSDTVGGVISDYLKFEKQRTENKKQQSAVHGKIDPEGEIRIGLGSCCVARGSGKLEKELEKILTESSIGAKIKRVGCVGMCYQTPLLEIVRPDGRTVLYTKVRPEDAKQIVLKHFTAGGIFRRTMNTVSAMVDRVLTDSIAEPAARYPVNVREKPVSDFLDRQKHIATECCGVIDPVDLDEYRSNGGFSALRKFVENPDAEDVINVIEKSGLRGRGGAGFPTHLKWRAVRNAESDTKYVVCNGDEGDPGAFMDRMLMESYPYRVIEGVILAGLVAGAGQGRFYIRSEYPLAIERMRRALDKCEQAGLSGDNILGSEYCLELKIVGGAGAFVCGEETALLASIEGRRGMPRLRPPYPAQKGLSGRPTLINNVETYSMVPWIIRNGDESFASLGTETSRGTKVFALAGKVARGGLIEVPMGITLRQIVEDIGGGIAGGLKFKAVQVGGPSGGCVPAELADVPVDYESLTAAGAIMGSGGLVVLDQSDCMVDIARYFLEFTQNQSCGKCTFCRIGTRKMLEILERICGGRGKTGDIESLQELAGLITQTSICGLGTTAPNPVTSTIEYFRHEYEAHINGKCPAGKCTALIEFNITDDCIGCTLCAQHCPVDAIEMRPYRKHEIDREKCVKCGACKRVCTVGAVEIN